jgi:hypothetical protein
MNELIDCGDLAYDHLVQCALQYVPSDVLKKHEKRIRIFSITKSDGMRLTRSFCKSRDIIILSERVFPKSGAHESDKDFRYFIYVVLHEVAHAVKNHLSPRLDRLSAKQTAAQEKEAKDLAFEWFNEHAKTLPYQPELSRKEIIQMEKARGVAPCPP